MVFRVSAQKKGRQSTASTRLNATTVNDDGDYDEHDRELAFDKPLKPKDRTKTEG